MIQTVVDLINSPPHYAGSRWECIEIIESLRLDYHRGNALKYLARYQKKGGEESVRKARWYIDRLLGNAGLVNTLVPHFAEISAMRGAMTGEEIAENFSITDECLIGAIKALRASVECVFPDVMMDYLRAALEGIDAYLDREGMDG